MRLLVAIHDVTPAFTAEIERLWSMCVARGHRPALLVVPQWHGEWPLEQHGDFVGWVRARAGEGADVFLHGERHDEAGVRRGVVDAVRAFGRTNREGEFLTLDRAQAHARIARGLARFHALGLDAIGFVAPAWLSRPECRLAIEDAGLAVSEDVGAVYLHRRAMRLASPVVRWSARRPWRAHASSLVERAARARFSRHVLVRIALHPQDLAHPAAVASIEQSLDWWTERRIPWTYSAL